MNDHRLNDRLTRHLHDTAEHTLLRSSSPETAMHLAERRAAHRRQFTAIGTVAAVTAVTVVGVGVLTRPNGTVDELPPAQAGTMAPVDTDAPGAASAFPPATLVGPQMVWNAVEPDSTAAVATVYSARSGAVFPGLAVSTGPASTTGSPAQDPTFQYWHSDDGVTFTGVDGRPSSLPLLESLTIGDHAYAFGTAPGVAVSEPNPILGAFSNDGGTTWDDVTIPFDTNEFRRHPQVESSYSYVSGLVDADGPVMVALDTGVSLDLDALGVDQPDLKVAAIGPEGVGMYAEGCAPSAASTVPVTLTAEEAAEMEAAAASATSMLLGDSGGPGGSCPIERRSWEDLGVSQELADMATGNARSKLFYAPDGRTFTELAPPVDEFRRMVLPSTTLPLVAVVMPDGTPRLFRTADGVSWAELPAPPFAVERLTELAGRLVAVGWDDRNVMQVATLDGDTWSTVAVDLLGQNYTSMYVGPGGLAIVGFDPATQGAGSGGTPAATTPDASIPSASPAVDTGPATTVLGAADQPPRQSIAYSLDGVNWSIESIDELLGDTRTADEQPSVLRISSAGNRLAVAVTLDSTLTHEPGGRQVVLVGTPTG